MICVALSIEELFFSMINVAAFQLPETRILCVNKTICQVTVNSSAVNERLIYEKDDNLKEYVKKLICHYLIQATNGSPIREEIHFVEVPNSPYDIQVLPVLKLWKLRQKYKFIHCSCVMNNFAHKFIF